MMSKRTLLVSGLLALAILLIAWQYYASKQKGQNTALSSEWRNSKNDLGNVTVAVLYEGVTDGPPVGAERSSGSIAKILEETRASLIFRGFWRWYPLVDSPDDIPPELAGFFEEQAKIKLAELPLIVEKSGYNYKELETRISAIKREIPGIIFVGAIPAQRINRIERNDVTGKAYGTEETWGMAFDPQKWSIQRNGKPLTKEEFQALFAGWHGWAESGSYDHNKVEAYLPDIMNPDYQELLLSWAKRQIDAGADAIWIDGLPQTSILYQLTGDLNHPAIKASFKASEKIVDEIHRYGKAKGRRIYVGAWAIPLKHTEGLPQMPSNIDFVTMTPTENEILDKKLDTSYEKISQSRSLYGNTPIFAFIDWSVDMSPTVVFSQMLGKKEQRELLKTLDASFAKEGVNFIYPVHGGHLGRGKQTERLAFGKYRNYDSLAPEFDTFGTITELAQGKK